MRPDEGMLDMETDRIERETLIAAPVERVWTFVVEPGFWVDRGSLAGTELSPGQDMVAQNPTHGDFPLRVVHIDPPHAISYRWASAFPGQALTEGNSTLIEFTLTAEGERTRLRVVESGFDALAGPEELRRGAVTDNSGGWVEELAALRKRIEGEPE